MTRKIEKNQYIQIFPPSFALASSDNELAMDTLFWGYETGHMVLLPLNVPCDGMWSRVCWQQGPCSVQRDLTRTLYNHHLPMWRSSQIYDQSIFE